MIAAKLVGICLLASELSPHLGLGDLAPCQVVLTVLPADDALTDVALGAALCRNFWGLLDDGRQYHGTAPWRGDWSASADVR
jgi:hypothetical protein